jgi:hypothetical protein
MAYEIPAALVGGALSGGVVLTGVYLTEHLTRRRTRDALLREDLQRANVLLPVGLAFLGSDPPDSRRFEIGSPGWDVDQQVTFLLLRMEATARHYPGDKGRRLREAIDDVNARYVAAKVRHLARGLTLSIDDRLAINLAEVSAALLPERPILLDDAIKRYVAEGFPSED